jgi:23S rRNA (cytidine1920-2'-O)/16S rRNA (cytidine1409-2'-O)-methyltransferase
VRRVARKRADLLLVSRGLAKSREKAQALIRGGRVSTGDTLLSKPAALLNDDLPLEISRTHAFVSRGGDKLDAALDRLSVDLRHAVVVDVGASTGGFTDCALKRGAERVYAVDVGHGQLDPSLRDDSRVVVREKTNARHLTRESFPEPIDVVLVDASFISLEKLAGALAAILPAGGRLIALVKPQFEVGRAVARSTRGVVRDETVREQAIASARNALVLAGFDVAGECDSAVHGPKGNIERFVVAVRRAS